MTDEQLTSESAGSEIPEWLLASLEKALSHDLPNQLVAILGLVRLLETEEGGRLGAEGQDYLRRIHAGVERSQRLVSTLVDSVRAARRSEPAQPIALAELIWEVAVEMQKLHPARSIAFQFDILVPTLTAPPRSFRQVLAVLLRQAVQCSREDAPRVDLRVESRKARTEIRITGNGPVLAAEVQERLFEPFVEGASEGTAGAGLVQARAFAERWGGHLYFEGGQDGNTFIFWLPADTSP
jgi:sigma-B regulation protein RsbU (phosphoserine phosphatase)